jgi:hypothetical protein
LLLLLLLLCSLQPPTRSAGLPLLMLLLLLLLCLLQPPTRSARLSLLLLLLLLLLALLLRRLPVDLLVRAALGGLAGGEGLGCSCAGHDLSAR